MVRLEINYWRVLSGIQLDVAAKAVAGCAETNRSRHKKSAQALDVVDIVEWRLWGQIKAKRRFVGYGLPSCEEV